MILTSKEVVFTASFVYQRILLRRLDCMIMNKIIGLMINRWIKNNVIDEDERELYEYGLIITIEYTLNLMTTILIAHYTDEWWACLFLYGSFMKLRSFSGGVHAKTFLRCYIYSSLVILVSLLLIKYNLISIWIYRLGALIGGIYLIYTNPVPSENKPLDEDEIECFTKKEKNIIYIMMLISIIAIFAGFDKIEKGIDSTFIIAAISVVISKIMEYSKRISIVEETIIRIAICDDDIDIANRLKKIVDESKVYGSCEHFVEVYNSAEEILEAVEDNECIDIIFMDIKLGDSNGIDVAREIKEICPDVMLVYVTAFQDYVYDVFDTVPIGFVVKPFDEEEINVCLKRAIKMLKKHEAIFVRMGKKILKVPIKDIMYMCSSGREIHIYDRNDEKYVQYGKLDDYERRLAPYIEFIRIHKSNLVNFDYVTRYEGKKVILMNDMELSISRDKRNCVRERYLEMIEI